jgi:hypothetical protein
VARPPLARSEPSTTLLTRPLSLAEAGLVLLLVYTVATLVEVLLVQEG